MGEAALLAGAEAPAVAGSPEMANPAFPWPVWTAAWLWSMPVACVSHWGTQRGAAGLGAWSSATMAALGGEVSPARVF